MKTSGVDDVEFGGRRRPLAVGLRADREVDAEQPGEEHQLAGQPHDHADADHVRSVQRVDPGADRGGPRRGWSQSSQMDYGLPSAIMRLRVALAARSGRRSIGAGQRPNWLRQVVETGCVRRASRQSVDSRPASRARTARAGTAERRPRAGTTISRREQSRAAGLQPPPGGPRADHHRDRPSSGAGRRPGRLPRMLGRARGDDGDPGPVRRRAHPRRRGAADRWHRDQPADPPGGGGRAAGGASWCGGPTTAGWPPGPAPTRSWCTRSTR